MTFSWHTYKLQSLIVQKIKFRLHWQRKTLAGEAGNPSKVSRGVRNTSADIVIFLSFYLQ